MRVGGFYMESSIKRNRRIITIIKNVIDENYYILPKRILEMQKLPYYKYEMLEKIKDRLETEKKPSNRAG